MFDALISVLSHDPSKTNHPNLLAIFDVGNVDGLQYLVSELLEGKTRRELLNDGATEQSGELSSCEVRRGLR